MDPYMVLLNPTGTPLFIALAQFIVLNWLYRRHLDIRLLPALVPQAYRNETARAIEPQLTARITRLRNLIDAGIIDQEQSNDDTPKSTCPFVVQAQLYPVPIPQSLMQDLEEETQRPTGRWTVHPSPKMQLKGVLVSKECGVLYEIVNSDGLTSHSFFRKVTTCMHVTSTYFFVSSSLSLTDAGLATISYLILLALLSRQMNSSRTPAGISRVSRWSFLTQSLVDAVSFAGHITFAILADGRPSLSLVAPAFLACVLFVYEAVSLWFYAWRDLILIQSRTAIRSAYTSNTSPGGCCSCTLTYTCTQHFSHFSTGCWRGFHFDCCPSTPPDPFITTESAISTHGSHQSHSHRSSFSPMYVFHFFQYPIDAHYF